jgi:hypothetical protein
MRLFCTCGQQLVIRHDIKLDVLSNFTYIDGTITITKHEVRGTKGLKPFFDESEVKSAYCKSCAGNMEFSEALNKCDNCGNNVSPKEITKLGDTLIVCERCVKGVKNFETFKIFGQRGPSEKTRSKRLENAVDLAREAMPELPQEVVEMLGGDEINLEGVDLQNPPDRVSDGWTTLTNSTNVYSAPRSTTSGGTDNV